MTHRSRERRGRGPPITAVASYRPARRGRFGGSRRLDWGEHQQADRYFLSFRPYDYFYTSQAEYHLGQIYEALGQRDRAVSHYQQFVTWWDHADPNLRPIWEDARQAVIRPAGRER